MKAIVVHGFGGEEVLRYEDVPDPVCGPRQVLIQVHAASVNRGDLDRREGVYPTVDDLPFSPGWDVAGVVESVGNDVTHCKPGDRVVGIVRHGYVEKALASRGTTILLPEGISYEAAAALPVTYLTAWYTMTRVLKVQPGEAVLVHGAAGGVGSAAVQVLGILGLGAPTIAAASGTEQTAFVSTLGADHVIDYQVGDWVQEVLRYTDGQGVHAVLDSVGSEILARSLECMAHQGRLVTLGYLRDTPTMLDNRPIVSGELQVMGFQLYRHRDSGHVLTELVQELAKGQIRPAIDRVFPLAQAAEAQRRLANRQNLGKIILVPE